MRMIDADALRARMYHDAFETDSDMQKWDGGCWIRYKMFENAIEDAPTIEPKKGKWIWDGESRREYPYKCSECGEIDYYAFLYDTETRKYKQQDNFCPNCGTDMRGEQNV